MFNALLKEVVPKNLKIPVNIAFSPLSGCKESLMGGSGGGGDRLHFRLERVTLAKTSGIVTGNREGKIDQ